MLEVVHAIALDLGLDKDRLEKVRQVKAGRRGGFAERLVWTGNLDPHRPVVRGQPGLPHPAGERKTGWG